MARKKQTETIYDAAAIDAWRLIEFIDDDVFEESVRLSVTSLQSRFPTQAAEVEDILREAIRMHEEGARQEIEDFETSN